ncbi:hypothetical protein JW935_15570 [candidate division KSB1 bacterium]|nr:hypothetical protein [candidate division KSB1 bacterium]
MKTCKMVVLILCLLGVGSAWAQESDSTLLQKFPKGFYRKSDGRLFVAQSLPLFLQLSTSPDEAGQLLADGGTQPVKLFLSEGKNIVQISGAILKFPDGSNKNATIDLWADGTPPVINVLFEKAAKYNSETLAYYGSGLLFNLESSDTLSGVQGTFISVNEGEFKSFSNTDLNLTRNGHFMLRFYAADNVGNVTKVEETAFTVDVTAPSTLRRITGDHKQNILSPQALVQLVSTDSLSGVKEIFYTLDDEKEQIYQEELAVQELSDGEHILSYYTVDNVANQEEKQVWPFYLDKTPPDLEYRIAGDVYNDETTTFVSGTSSIHITGTDRGAGLAEIYYNIDTSEQQLYHQPIDLTRQTGLKQIYYSGRDSVGNQSVTMNRKIYVDQTPPESMHDLTGSVLSLGDTILINNATRIVLGAIDMESGVREIRYSLNDKAEIAYQESFSLNDEGLYRFKYLAIDRVNNIEPEHSVFLRVDNSPRRPVTSVPPSTHPKLWQERESTDLVGSTELPFYLRIATGPEETAESFMIDLNTVVTKDTKPLYFDNQGRNQMTMRLLGKEAKFLIPIDGTAPKTTAQFEGAQQSTQKDVLFYSPGLTVILNAADENTQVISGLAKTFYSVDGSEFSTYKGRITLFDREKDYEFRYYSVDSVGNAEKVQKYAFTVDTSPPRTRLSVGGIYYGNTLAVQSIITLTATDYLSGVNRIYFSFDEEEKETYSGDLTGSRFERLSPGRHILKYYAVDFVGNTEQMRTFEFYYDPDRPSVTLQFAGDLYESKDQTFVSGRAKIVLSANDPTSDVKAIMAGLDNAAPVKYNEALIVPKSNGRHSVTFFASDLLDNMTSRSTLNFIVDVNPPKTTLAFRGPQYFDGERLYISNRTEIVLDSQDASSGIENVRYRLGQQAWQRYNKPFSINTFGAQRLLYYAQDRVNNREESQSRQFFVDNQKPEISISSSNQQFGQNKIPQSAAIYLTATDGHAGIDVITYKLNGKAEQIYRTPITGFAAGETVELFVTARDRVGNTSEKRVTYQIVKDQ